MGFFDKVKQALNIGGVKVEMTVGPDISRTSGKADGTLTLTTKSPQHIKSIKVKFERTIRIPKPGAPNNEEVRFDTLADFQDNSEFDIQPGETKTVPFSLTFNLPDSANEQLAQLGGILGAIGGLGNKLDQSRIEYKISANVDVDKAALDATDVKDVRVV